MDEIFKRFEEQQAQDRIDELKNNPTRVSRFIDLCSDMDISISTEDLDYNPVIGLHADKEGILSALLPSIETDKDGLYSVEDLLQKISAEKIQPGFLKTSDFILIASPLFRRKFHRQNNFAPHFIALFWGINNLYLDAYIALDADRVRIDDGSMCYMEKDTWYGAPFKEDISRISDGVVKLAPPVDLRDEYTSFVFNDAFSLEVKWTTKDNIKTFQAIEFHNDKVFVTRNGVKLHPARYLHGEYDINQSIFRHFDGAIQYFTEEEYLARRASDFNYDQKSKSQLKAGYEKIFKINGKLDIDKWVELCSHFFTGNPLIHEYFTGELPKHTSESVEKLRRADANRVAGGI